MLYNKKNLILLILFGLFFSCSRVKTINLKNHSFNNYPSNLVFIQIPGLSEEHMGYLHFKNLNFNAQTELEKYSCFGKMWSYNMMTVTPDIDDQLLTQLNGYSLPSNSCEKYQRRAIWDVLNGSGYSSSVIYRGKTPKFKEIDKCNTNFYKNTRLFVSGAKEKVASDKETFHFQQKKEYQKGSTYYDKSCKRDKCFSTTTDLFNHVLTAMNDSNRRFINIVDYELLNILNKQDVKGFTSYMSNLNNFLIQVRKRISKTNDYLIVVSSASPKAIDWKRINKKWRSIPIATNKKSQLMSPVWADGALAENFCGLYLESDLNRRFFWRSEETTLPF